MSPVRVIVWCVVLAALVAGCSADARQVIRLDGVEVRVRVADGDDERSRGLQGYDALPDGEGMLFVWDDAAVRTFAMKEVDFAIDVVFIGDDLTVAAIEPLDPGDTHLVSSPGPCGYVVELPQGWAAGQGIAVGDEFVYEGER